MQIADRPTSKRNVMDKDELVVIIARHVIKFVGDMRKSYGSRAADATLSLFGRLNVNNTQSTKLFP